MKRTRRESAEFLNANGYPITKLSLDKMASRGEGPKYKLFGNRALYEDADLLGWAEGRLREPRTAA